MRDTFINLDTTHNAAEPILILYTWPAQMAANVVLLQWDVSEILGATVESATLTLHLEEGAIVPEYTAMVHEIVGVQPNITLADGYNYDANAPWTPSACCYEGIPMAQANLGPALDSATIGLDAATVVAWDVTAAVSAAVLSGNPVVLAVNPDVTAPADAARTFTSSEGMDLSARPRLIVEYIQ